MRVYGLCGGHDGALHLMLRFEFKLRHCVESAILNAFHIKFMLNNGCWDPKSSCLHRAQHDIVPIDSTHVGFGVSRPSGQRGAASMHLKKYEVETGSGRRLQTRLRRPTAGSMPASSQALRRTPHP